MVVCCVICVQWELRQKTDGPMNMHSIVHLDDNIYDGERDRSVSELRDEIMDDAKATDGYISLSWSWNF